MTFIARFREVVRRDGARVAIEDGVRRETYEDLDESVRAIGAHLRARGVGVGDVVAIRSRDRTALVRGMLGAWYARAAFVVITPDLPDERARAMERDACARVTLDDDVLGNTRDLPRETRGARNRSDTRGARAEDLAYVVFTSGTTGAPKGVLVTQAGIVPMLDAQIAAFELAAGARATWMLSPLFDASMSDVGTALLAGATIVAMDVRGVAPREIAARLEALRVTHADLPPSLLALFGDAIPSTLRTIVVGGEPCADHVVARVASRVRLVNVYGPSEATVCTSMNVCTSDARHAGRIGAPLSHVTYRVEDDELLIGGTCLARGYANDDALTAARFVVRDGARFYRTGDRVRAREDGELAWVGRLDRQVKIAGVRIEPEEIESHLRADASVLDVAVAIVRRALVAFVVLQEGANLEDVRAGLAARVPRWLVPARFIETSALPRTASNKVDYAALSNDIDRVERASHTPDEIERAIADAFASALARSTFDRDEDFVAAGADSLALLAACAAADARGVILSPETIALGRTARRVAASDDLSGRTATSLARDVDEVARDVVNPGKPARAVFVTGATGTLGARLVHALVARGASVTCLVRAPDDAAAHARMIETCGDLPLVRAMCGDVALERFGWSVARWNALANEHDAIVHAAADLRLTATYAALRATNVLGARHAADFATTGARKALHHVSTLSVFASSNLRRSGRMFDESMELHSARIVYGGYAQSKWAGERVVRGAHVTRLGLLLPARGRDLFGAFVRASRDVGCLPCGDDARFDVTDADFAAAAIAHFVTSGDPGVRVRHVAGSASASLDDLASALSHAGVRIERTSMDEFRRRVLARANAMDALALASFRALWADDAASRAFDLFEATNVDLGASRTHVDLARVGIACPSTSDTLASAVESALAWGLP